MTPLFIGGIGMQEVLLIALVVLLFFGGKKIGKGVRSFKEGMNNIEKEVENSEQKK